MSQIPKATETLSISVQPSAETNDYEVLLTSEMGNLIDRFGQQEIGLDPRDILVEPSPLMPRDSGHLAVIGRCGCGYAGCGRTEVLISTEGDVVVWSSPCESVQARFSREQYIEEIQRAAADFSWETPDRTAARLIASLVDRDSLGRAGFEFEWASGCIEKHKMSIAMRYAHGRYQVVVDVPWHNEPPETIAQTCRSLLLGDPSSWSDVRWFPQSGGAIGAPDIAGPGWRIFSS